MNTDFIIMAIAVVIVIVLAFWRFSSGNYGSLAPNSEVAAAYTTYHIDPDRNYYVSGPAAFPNAILGLDKSLTLDSDLWKRIEPTPDKMKDLVENMTMRAAETFQSLQGYDVIDEKGRKTGNWFSLPGIDIMIRRTGENSFSISTPAIETGQDR
ncbi:MAG: hypothetical protein K0B01_03805 [Syntrophobacterales bacterium]|nr:hypothetical protein [Syntrophobacterales bacterium]